MYSMCMVWSMCSVVCIIWHTVCYACCILCMLHEWCMCLTFCDLIVVKFCCNFCLLFAFTDTIEEQDGGTHQSPPRCAICLFHLRRQKKHCFCTSGQQLTSRVEAQDLRANSFQVGSCGAVGNGEFWKSEHSVFASCVLS